MSDRYFPVFGLNKEMYGYIFVVLRVMKKYEPQKTLHSDRFTQYA